MKSLGLFAALIMASLGCENGKSKLDDMPTGATPTATTPADHSGTLDDRVARLEATFAKNAEALDFLAKVYEQQKQQQQHGRPGEPDPNAVFAVDISKDLAAGQVDGPNDALVTIVEAWDFG
ncbi:MAG TPA: hypothetical protein VGO00_08970 [Kofleriaceae bacterium]|nr:hypothetical protein [Kofleriaceae bacterium]